MNDMSDLASSLTEIRGELSVRIQKMSDLIRAIEYFIEDPSKIEIPYMVAVLAGKPQGNEPGTPGHEKSTVENAVAVIRTAGLKGLSTQKGMKTQDIMKALQEAKCPVKGNRPIQTLYGILYKDSKSKHPRVRRTKDGYWEAA